jgi:hypothetical protein
MIAVVRIRGGDDDRPFPHRRGVAHETRTRRHQAGEIRGAPAGDGGAERRLGIAGEADEPADDLFLDRGGDRTHLPNGGRLIEHRDQQIGDRRVENRRTDLMSEV